MGVTWEIAQEPPGRFIVTLEGSLREGEERGYLEELEHRAAPLTGPVTVMFVLRNESFDYDLGCFMPHARLFRRLWPKLNAVAVARVSPAVRVGVAAMGLMVSLPVRGFKDVEGARAWLNVAEAGSVSWKRAMR
jgi:hypothetical protein